MLLQEQQADVAAMMLNNELLMIEEALISLGHSSTQSGDWLHQLQLLDRTLCNGEPLHQLEQLDGQLEAADFQQLLKEDPTLALTHAHQRAASLAGQLVRSHKLQCAYFEECIQCKALELQPLQETLRAEKVQQETYKKLCEQAKMELAQQQETITNLMDLSSTFLPPDTTKERRQDKQTIHAAHEALHKANAEKAVYQAALEQAEEQLLLASKQLLVHGAQLPTQSPHVGALSYRSGIPNLSPTLLKDHNDAEPLSINYLN